MVIEVNKALCGKGFGDLQRYSSIHGDVLMHKDIFPLTRKQCLRAHEDRELTMNLGSKRITLNTAFLGSQQTVAFLNGESYTNMTCEGTKKGEKMWLGPSNPAVPSKGREIVKNLFTLDLETKQFELDLEEKVLTVNRLGLEVTVDSFENLTHTDNSGTIVVDSDEIPKSSCKQTGK